MKTRAVRVGRLDSLGAISKELGRLYRAGRSKREDSADVARLSTVLRTLMECHRLAEIEPRLAALEAQAQEPGATFNMSTEKPIYLDGVRRTN
jgi:hypothetical protein